ncbi:nucleotidyltransferase family protein [Candidatus Ferrigenium straubiae]|jgi:dTDP-glucose pyrophosphorylase|uniref:nucleotidyltransferase family protein n=1 Tax=Candidatus Ferrigenium straubiae TaxID=2919506 RepID=UPI003F4AB91D
MKDIKKILVSPDSSIRDTIQLIDSSAMQIALVVDGDNHLLGTVTDGDVRRGILRGVALNETVDKIMNPNPSVCREDDAREAILTRMEIRNLRHMPVVDKAGRVVRLETHDELLAPKERDNLVVLMAGGLGVRLRPLTENCPKPMLKIGGRPILETILLNFIEYGFRRFYLSVNYMSEAITEYFGDGSRWGVDIRYLRESQKLGTAGALSLLPERPNSPILVMNGDLLTKVNFTQLVDFHGAHRSKATMCVREYDFQVPYGVVKMDHHSITAIEEKPVQTFFVNAGIYMLEPEILDMIPKSDFFDMPTLFDRLIADRSKTIAFPVREYWLDIGHVEDFERANLEHSGDAQ